MILDDLKHAQRERLLYLDRCLTWRGTANRRDLIGRFGISAAQAALDFRTYLELNRSTPPVYDAARKCYVAARPHAPLEPSSVLEAFETLVENPAEAREATLDGPGRMADPAIIARCHQALRSGDAIHIRYTSISSGTDTPQWIAPVQFTSDGESVHLRAFSFRHWTYRTYLPIRIDPASSFERRPVVETLPLDVEWNTRAIVWLRPRTGLSPAQAHVVRQEYGFEGETLRIETRKPLEFFLDRRWGLDQVGARLERARTEYEPIRTIAE